MGRGRRCAQTLRSAAARGVLWHPAGVAFERVASVGDLPAAGGLAVRAGGIDVALFAADGGVYALEDRCPHADAPLSDGALHGCVVVCAAHGWDFDIRTGFKPDDPDGFPIPRFAVELRGGEVWVDVERIENRPPSRRR